MGDDRQPQRSSSVPSPLQVPVRCTPQGPQDRKSAAPTPSESSGQPIAVRHRPEQAHRVNDPGRSAAFGPVPLQPRYRIPPAQRGHLPLGKPDTGEQQVHDLGWHTRRWRFGRASVRLDAVPYTRPEIGLGDVQLISKYVTPQARPVVATINRVRDSGAQNPTIGKTQLTGHMTGAGPSARVSHRTPAFDSTEAVVVLARRPGPTHRNQPTGGSPTIQARSVRLAPP